MDTDSKNIQVWHPQSVVGLISYGLQEPAGPKTTIAISAEDVFKWAEQV
jgi:hypothetical protein